MLCVEHNPKIDVKFRNNLYVLKWVILPSSLTSISIKYFFCFIYLHFNVAFHQKFMCYKWAISCQKKKNVHGPLEAAASILVNTGLKNTGKY